MRAKQISVRLTTDELSMIRHALTIGAEDGSLIENDMDGNEVPESAELFDRVVRKIEQAMRKTNL